jgi:nitronate monooxygenase
LSSATTIEKRAMWPDRRLLDLFKIEHPIVLAPMAGAMDWELAAAVAEAGGLGSLPCGMLTADKMREEVGKFRMRTQRPINLNFFAHRAPTPNNAREADWRTRLMPYYRELGVDPAAPAPQYNRAPFDDAALKAVLDLKPEVVSFQYGLPEDRLLAALREAGMAIVGCATTVAEARWLAGRKVSAIVAQGYEAGGHRGMFLSDNIATQAGTFALVPQVVDAVQVPVIAAGGVADARGLAAALALGAAGAQIGTAFLRSRESTISRPFREALAGANDESTVLTNVMSGRPARGIINRLMREVGPIADGVPEFPLATAASAPLRAKSEAAGSGDFSPMWAGQAAALACEMPAGEFTRRLAAEAQAMLRGLAV